MQGHRYQGKTRLIKSEIDVELRKKLDRPLVANEETRVVRHILREYLMGTTAFAFDKPMADVGFGVLAPVFLENTAHLAHVGISTKPDIPTSTGNVSVGALLHGHLFKWVVVQLAAVSLLHPTHIEAIHIGERGNPVHRNVFAIRSVVAAIVILPRN